MNHTDLADLRGRTFDAVLFDNDGTLTDSVPATVRAWATWAAEYGITTEQLADQHGVPALQTARLLVPDRHVEAFERIEALELADVDDIRALPGAVDALAALGRCAAIVTSATRPLASVRLEAAGLLVPHVLVTVDDVTHGKPDPEPYLLAASRLGVDPARCLVVEDAPAGLTSGRAAGCATLGLATTHEADHLQADAVVADLTAVRFEVDDAGVQVRPARCSRPVRDL